MTRAEYILQENTTVADSDSLYAMSIHAQEFAEWCCDEGWVHLPIENIWFLYGSDQTVHKTTSELYTLFNNQNK